MKSILLFFRSKYSLCVVIVGTIIVLQAITFEGYRRVSFENVLIADLFILMGLLLFSRLARYAGLLFFVGLAAFLLWSLEDGFGGHWSSMNARGTALLGMVILQLAAGYYLGASKSFSIEFEEQRANAPSWVRFVRTAIVACIVLYWSARFVHGVLILVNSGR